MVNYLCRFYLIVFCVILICDVLVCYYLVTAEGLKYASGLDIVVVSHLRDQTKAAIFCDLYTDIAKITVVTTRLILSVVNGPLNLIVR